MAPRRRKPQITHLAERGPIGNPAALSTEDADDDPILPNMVPFVSSRVLAAGYDSKNQRLYVEWVKPGQAYVYEGVPSYVWATMNRVSSPGRFINSTLNRYDYHPL